MELLRIKKPVILFILLIFLLIGCNKTKDPIKIGVLGTMTGINSDLSVSGRRGIEIAIDDINNDGGIGGKKIELVIKDDLNNGTTAQSKYEEFINENISVVIGPFTSGMIINSIDYIRKSKILILGSTISADSLSNTDDNFIRFIASTKEQAEVLNKVALHNNNKKFAVVYDLDNQGFNQDLISNFKELLENNKGEIILTKTFSAKESTNFGLIAEEIKNSSADGVFIIANSANNADLCQQMKKINCNVQVYSPLWSNTDDLLKNGGSAVEGMYIVGGIDLDSKSTEFIKFKESYFGKYGENPTFASVYSYETAKALIEAIKINPNMNPEDIKKSIIKTGSYSGVEGEFKIDEFGDTSRNYMIFKIINNQLKRVL